MRSVEANGMQRRVRRGWFAETLVVLGIIAFAFFAMTLQGQQSVAPAPALSAAMAIG